MARVGPSRSSGRGVFRAPSRLYWQRRHRPLAGRGLTSAGVPLVDVVVESLPVTVTKTAAVPLVETVVEVLPVTVTKRVSLSVVDVVVEPRGLIVQPRTVSVVVEVFPVTVTKIAHLGVVDVVVDTPPVTAGATQAARVDVVVEVLPVTVSFGGTGASRRGVVTAISLPGTRIIAQEILSGRWLHWDLPLSGLEITWPESGPVVIGGKIAPEQLDLADVGLEPWACWLHVEESGLIRASGILQPVTIDDETLSIEAVGPSGYAAKIPYRGTYSEIGVDPADVVRHLWSHIQNHPRGNLGVQVHGTTPVRLGTEPSEPVDFVTGGGTAVSFDRGGPYKLNWFENKLIGAEINDLAGEAPFSYLERSQWNSTKTGVEHHIDLWYPRSGTRRTDLRFAQGENIIESAPIEEPDGVYADEVFVQGRGEGETAIAGRAATSVGNRLRLPVVVVDKEIPSVSRAKARASEELAARLAALVEVPEVAIDTRHPNAPLGSFGPGDEIRVDLDLPYVGRVSAWHRVSSVRWIADRDAAVLALTRRSEFADR